jgi:monooxygenase
MHQSSGSSQKTGKLYDLIIVGAGLSGIGTAYWLQQKCPGKEFIILEGKEALGGTWRLFRYPGVRSDSDMFTFSYKFKPWKKATSLLGGDEILNYLEEAAVENGIDKKIRYNHKVSSASWCSKEKCWTLEVQSGDENIQFKSRFLYMCSGYYSYEEGHRPDFAGEKDFKGEIVFPQFWPEGLIYTNKRVVIVGSGATAVTLVPAMAEKASHITMLQRSPTYIVSQPNNNGLFQKLEKWLPAKRAYKITRRVNLLLNMSFYHLSRAFPAKIKRLLMAQAEQQLKEDYVAKNFTPGYNPWDQRLCVAPDGDFFRAIKKGKASVVTDEISHFTASGIQLKSGQSLQADLIVLATGLKVRLFGGAKMEADGEKVNIGDAFFYKGMMISNVPNFAMAFGYTNASWTLKTDLTANYICRLLQYMDSKGYGVVTPRIPAGIIPDDFMPLQSGYIRRAIGQTPQQGSRKPWRVYQNYLVDIIQTRFSRIKNKALEFDPQTKKDECK